MDVDGVLNNEESRRLEMISMHPTFVKRLENILRVTDCEIVISSNWRIGGYKKEDSNFKTALRKACVDLDEDYYAIHNQARYDYICSKIIGATPQKMSLYHRGQEIYMWLEEEKEETNTTYNFVIVDDDPNTEPLEHRHVLTNDVQGLSEKAMNDVIAMFEQHK